ncbi:MAG: hypothetical protein NVS2B3_07440 [Vulcanimicrobiaceae bacterium]
MPIVVRSIDSAPGAKGVATATQHEASVALGSDGIQGARIARLTNADDSGGRLDEYPAVGRRT